MRVSCLSGSRVTMSRGSIRAIMFDWKRPMTSVFYSLKEVVRNEGLSDMWLSDIR